jgi:uncharacterized protein (TIGR03437 family)
MLILWCWGALFLAPAYAQIDIIQTVAGNGEVCCRSGDGFAASLANVPQPIGVKAYNGELFIMAETRVRRVRQDGLIETLTTIPGAGIGTVPASLAIDGSGRVHVADRPFNNRILRLNNDGMADTIVGLRSFLETGQANAENVPATSVALELALLDFDGFTFDRAGNMYIAEASRHCVRIVSPDGRIRTIAGRRGSAGFGGDGGPATSATLNGPRDVAVDDSGNIYIADTGNHRIRRVSPGGTIETWAGSAGPDGGFAGDGGRPSTALLRSPVSLAIDSKGSVYIGDAGNRRIRRVSPDGIIRTVAGSGNTTNCFSGPCYDGDGRAAVDAKLSLIGGISIDDAGNLFIADSGNNRVRKVTFSAPASALPPPVLSSRGVVHGATYEPGVAPGSWATIQGEYLAPLAAPGRTWRPEEITNGDLPLSLEGVRVRVNGRQAPIYFVGPGQINFQVPDDPTVGRVPVEVETSSGVARTTAELRRFAPAFFVIGQSRARLGGSYAAAIHQNGTIVGMPEDIPGTSPARAGELITLFGTGFGPTNPPTPAGRVPPTAPMATSFNILLDGNPVATTFAGITGVGLYQFNVQLPARLAPGDYFVWAFIGGVQSPFGVIIPVR